MDSCPNPKPHHALCLPFPAQSHIKAMLKLAKLLHHKGFHITFVNTEYNHKRFLKTTTSDHPDSSFGSHGGFRFETIPDGMPPSSDPDVTQDVPSLCESTRKNFSAPLLDLIAEINDKARAEPDGVVSDPPVSCLVVDGFMSFAGGSVAKKLGIPHVKFFSIAACGLLGMYQYRPLLERGLVPLKGESCLTNGYLDTALDWVPGMKDIRLRDLPSFCRITDTRDIMFNFCIDSTELAHEASSVIIQTFGALEQEILDTLSTNYKLPNLYSIGPLELLLNPLPEDPIKPMQYNLWKENTECLKWLDTQNPNSVMYVNFGSVTVLTPQQVVELGWGLAKSNRPFLWVIRRDLVIGESACLSDEFLAEIRGRSVIIDWCPQEDVLNHPSVGGFLTHCGWNSILESLSSGVPMLCYPFFAEQQTNCWLICSKLGVGLEIDNDVKRGQVEELVRELMEKEKGKEMKSKAMEWKRLAEEATSPQGSSSINLDKLVSQVLLKNNDA